MKKLMLSAVLMGLVGFSTPLAALTRLVAQFKGFTTEMVSTAAPLGVPPASGGTIIYDTAPLGFFMNPGDDTLFITVTGTADTHNGAANMVACLLDGVACNSGAPPSSGVPGWMVWQRAAPTADLHDNAVVARWCVAGVDSAVAHNVQIRLGVFPSGGANVAFLEAAHFVIESEFMGGGPLGCGSADPVGS